MGYKEFIIPGREDIQTKIKVGDNKHFYVAGDVVYNTTQKVLQKLGIVAPFNLDYGDDIPVGVSAFGTLVFDNLTIPPGYYTLINTKGVVESVPYKGIVIDTVVFEASQQKNIVKTEIAGRDGAVKEYISSNDTAITMRGAVINALSGAYPRQDVQDFIRILNVPQQIRVVSKFVNDVLGFEFITIESWNMITTPGLRNVQAFTVTAVNDISPEVDEIYGTDTI